MPKTNRAQEFFDTHVTPAVNDWRDSPNDIRKAMHAAVELNQMADYFWHEFSSSDPSRVTGSTSAGEFRKELGHRVPDFAVLRDVAEAHKHMKISRAGRYVTSAGQTVTIKLGWGEAEFGEDEWGGSKSIVVTLDDGTRKRLKYLIEGTVKMWESLLR